MSLSGLDRRISRAKRVWPSSPGENLTLLRTGRMIFRFCKPVRSRFVGVWRSLVAHLLWEQGVGGSNPSTPTSLQTVAPVAQPDRATAFGQGAFTGKRNPWSGGHCIGRTLTRGGDGNTEETVGRGAAQACVAGAGRREGPGGARPAVAPPGDLDTMPRAP